MTAPLRLLVTGGAGYIGAQLVLDLLRAGHDVTVVDNFSTGHPMALARVEALSGKKLTLHVGDIAEPSLLARALAGVHAVFHLAGMKMVGESMERPARYFSNNVGGMTALIEAMHAAGVRRIVYSSSASVYGTREEMPLVEDAPLAPASPYGATKVHGEQILEWMVACHGWSALSLRYFNPVGAHESGKIGQPFEGAASLVPRALIAVAKEKAGARLAVFGTDWPTPDGTCLRDYIHIEDLSRAHLLALDALDTPGHRIFNVGTGRPHSVREVLAACARATGRAVPADDTPRRAGDVACSVADPGRFQRATGFAARMDLDSMVSSAWRWCEANPEGYGPQPRSPGMRGA